MSATLGGALKAFVEGQQLGISVYRDAPPAGTALPYCTVAEDLSLVGDGLEDGAAATGTEVVQLDLWQQWRDPQDKPLESRVLADKLHRALAGIQLPTAPTRVYGVLVQNRIRIVERGDNIVHTAFTLGVHRQI